MGLSENVTKWILYGAPMHDVGKIGIPDRILLKPGKLDADELFVKNAIIDPGPIMPRWRPRAYGRASRIRKRMSHIKVIVSTEAPREYKESRRWRTFEAPKKRGKKKKKK